MTRLRTRRLTARLGFAAILSTGIIACETTGPGKVISPVTATDIRCIDYITGESFTYNTSTARDIWIGATEDSTRATITDWTGRVRRMSQREARRYTCKPEELYVQEK